MSAAVAASWRSYLSGDDAKTYFQDLSRRRIAQVRLNPAWRAATLDPIDAFRADGVSRSRTFGERRVERLSRPRRLDNLTNGVDDNLRLLEMHVVTAIRSDDVTRVR
jgi:hypothetical protein